MDSPSTSSVASSSSSRSSRKRAHPALLSLSPPRLDDGAFEPGPDVAEPQLKKRAPRTSAADKAAKKSARMERNRIAAQASRDRKRNHTEYLESRVADLEAQLEQHATARSSSSSPATNGLYTLPLLPTPPTHDDGSSTADPGEVARLRDENASLRTQLELEKLESQGLKLRLTSLEGKFGRLEALLEKLGTASPTPVSSMTNPGLSADVGETRGRRDIVGGGGGGTVGPTEPEHVVPLDPVVPGPTPSYPPSDAVDVNLDLGLDLDLSNNALGLFDDAVVGPGTTAMDVVDPPLFDSDPALALAFDFDAPAIDDSTLSQVWSEWSHTVAPPTRAPLVDGSTRLGGSTVLEVASDGVSTESAFDLFEFLDRQEVAHAHPLVEAGC
ncbi:hypothetical protein JCM10212_006522 [Sporobolomyces blumeae]